MGKPKICKDHLGNTFKSVNEMCKFHNKSYAFIRSRIDRGWSIKKALTEPCVKSSQAIKCKDHLGNVFSSQKEKCEFWNISSDTYCRRIKYGMSEKDALTKPINTTHKGRAITDHTGKKHASYTKLCEYWNINNETLTARLESGMSMKEALTTPVGYTKIVQDHLNNTFATQKEMCAFWRIKPHSYQYRRDAGYDLKKALATETFKSGDKAGIYTIIDQLSLDYYLVSIKNTDPFVCHITKLLDEYHNQGDQTKYSMKTLNKAS